MVDPEASFRLLFRSDEGGYGQLPKAVATRSFGKFRRHVLAARASAGLRGRRGADDAGRTGTVDMRPM